jgi:hypothetical protein
VDGERHKNQNGHPKAAERERENAQTGITRIRRECIKQPAAATKPSGAGGPKTRPGWALGGGAHGHGTRHTSQKQTSIVFTFSRLPFPLSLLLLILLPSLLIILSLFIINIHVVLIINIHASSIKLHLSSPSLQQHGPYPQRRE